MKDLLSEIESYWTTRAEGYSEVNHKELNGMQKGAWLEVLKGQFPEKAKDEIKILDIGTGPGFFPVILAEAGYKVTAVDYTQEMLDTAKRNAGNLCERISFYKMDAQNLEFEDDVFDVVISRNLTWNLKDPKRAYEEWCRVLKPGGKLLNFDANWYGYLYDEEKRLSYEEDRKSVESEHLDDHYLCTDIDRMEKIALQMPLSSINRPSKNLNRVFPGNPQGTRMDRLAYEVIQKLHSAADYYIDLHSGDDYEQLTPYIYYAGCADEDVVQMSRKMAEQADVPYMVKSNVASGGSYNYAAACGIPSVLIERGQMGGWSPEEVHSTRKDMRNILCALGVYDGMRSYSNYYPMEIEDVRYQSASVSGLWYPAKKPGDIIKVGEYLGCVKDYEGNILETSLSDLNGVVLYQTGSLQVIKDGPMIAYGSFSRRKDERKEKITNYWAKRSDSFMEQRRAELHSDMADKWLKEIGTFLPDGKLRILDVGCGAGFFSILLAKLGHEVTGIDLTPDMIIHSRELAKEENASCTFEVMDAENPDFPDGTFDVIVSRNLTWTLPDAARAYKEWIRVLKTGGILINADANYGADDFSDTADLPANHAHFTVGDAMMQECEEIKRQLPISSYVRPAWDLETLGKLGINRFSIDLGISSRIYTKKDEFYNPTPMFLICGEKNKCNN